VTTLGAARELYADIKLLPGQNIGDDKKNWWVAERSLADQLYDPALYAVLESKGVSYLTSFK
jgi:hypothetical protein